MNFKTVLVLAGIVAAAFMVPNMIQTALAQAATSSACSTATDDGSASSGVGSTGLDVLSGASCSAGDESLAAGGDFASCPDSEADDGACSSAER
jgi:hypothetical protein